MSNLNCRKKQLSNFKGVILWNLNIPTSLNIFLRKTSVIKFSIIYSSNLGETVVNKIAKNVIFHKVQFENSQPKMSKQKKMTEPRVSDA